MGYKNRCSVVYKVHYEGCFNKGIADKKANVDSHCSQDYLLYTMVYFIDVVVIRDKNDNYVHHLCYNSGIWAVIMVWVMWVQKNRKRKHVPLCVVRAD